MMKFKSVATADKAAQRLMVKIIGRSIPTGRFVSKRPIDVEYTEYFKKRNPENWALWEEYKLIQKEFLQLKQEEQDKIDGYKRNSSENDHSTDES